MTENASVLVVEDDPKVRKLLRNVLEGDGFHVVEAMTTNDVLSAISNQPIDLITLDLHLGTESGLELAREVRRVSSVPIIMVTGRDDIIDRVVGLELGADDYITKPFHIREVLARIHAVMRRTGGAVAGPERDSSRSSPEGLPCFVFDGVRVIPDKMEVIDREGEDCGLTAGDFALLKVFIERPLRILSRDQLMDLTGGVEWSPLDRTIDNQVARLRKKIERNPSEPKLIKTVRGVGYTFACDVEPCSHEDCYTQSA